ncbi:DUF6789 family protein [Halalkalicoccus sp. NIPERK01]|uniref:DUF6789 family protein n=1 Tax=Halalkalicoccus sp. NIPERK01 TaxID=3053469 RepID=UPI00256EA388|nr:DUF6789 family protein [Halalkalicoccus sp. NIPERK01]MDL5363761.1 hypothetical protein [Halalkalicoccus sp. NIPERK01]
MNRFLRAISAGVAATTVMMLVFLFSQVQTRSQLGAPEAIARFVGMPEHHVVGFAVFSAVGILVWPVVFVAVRDRVADRRGPRDPTVQGLVFGGVLWVLFLVLGTGQVSWPFVILYLFFTLTGHLAYGFVLGYVYERLA